MPCKAIGVCALVALLCASAASADDRGDRISQEQQLSRAARDQFLRCVDAAAGELFDLRLRPGEIADAAIGQCEASAESYRRHQENAAALTTSEPSPSVREDAAREEERLLMEARRRGILVAVERIRAK